tara:strand:+ start:249 stop:455 length:207 start_codon:yes stop_codon:yes gene_type:complete
MNLSESETIDTLVKRVIEISGDSKKEIERYCWMVVHEYCHGVMPSEYDIREINEDLYLALLKIVKELK